MLSRPRVLQLALERGSWTVFMAIDSRLQTNFAVVEGAPGRTHHILENRYGHFDAETRAFVLTNVLTPRPWVNVLSNGEYGLVVSQLGGGFSWRRNSQLERLTRWEQDLAHDAYGRWVYVYDLETDEVRSTTFAPVRQAAEEEEVCHGLGWTAFRRRFGSLETTQTVFVPTTGSCEHTIVEIRNWGSSPKTVRVGSYLEWHLGFQGDWHREFHRLFMSLRTGGNALYAWKRTGLKEGSREELDAPMTAYVSVAGLAGVRWFADKAQWLGRAGRFDRPDGVVRDVEPVVTERWDDPIAAIAAVVEIPAGGAVRFALTLGAEDTPALAERAAEVDLSEIEQRFEEAKVAAHKRAGSLAIESSDEAFDLMNNAWLPHQAEVGRMLARCAYYQQGGAYGFRDQLQDSLSLLETDPATTLTQLGRHAEAMYEDGGVRHWWHPNSDIFAVSHHSDTCLWLPYGVLEYLDETAADSVLDADFAYLSRRTEREAGLGSLLDHCQRGIARFLERRSPRGLPLIGSGDWNDGLSHAGIDGKGESAWLAMFGFAILNRFAEVLDRRGDSGLANRYRIEAAALQQAVETHAWDGEWYIAGTSDDGRPFGSRESVSGKIFLNPQTWAAITGIGSRDRISSALAAVRERLVKPYGALLLAPAYSDVDPYVGYITRYAPGLRENGGVYSHASTWAVQAFAEAGDPETAYAIYRGMLPPIRSALDADAYQAEPFVMPGNVDGPDSPFEGRAGWTWYTGSAAWMRRVAVRNLMGVRATADGLLIQPTLPIGLGPVRLSRPFRGDTFEIEIEAGPASAMIVDGVEHPLGVVASSGAGEQRRVRVVS